jgi:nitroimidazol reductase NimA-like FMN-containing flavoprotein (pyridoxamine 5'-phosphate oxidase superfamily)
VYNPTGATTPSRHPERASYDAKTVHAILDEALVCHVGFIADRRPQVLPMFFVRLGSTVFFHASIDAYVAQLAAAAGGLELALETSIVDALVLGRAEATHSANYRSVVAHGVATLVDDPKIKRQVLAGLMEKLLPGRTDTVRAPTESELLVTAVVALPLEQVSAKVRTGPPIDAPEDVALECWAGVVPLSEVRGTPVPAFDLRPGIDLPASLK